MFLLKKIVGMLVMPLPVILLVLFIGLVYLWRKRPERARWWLSAGVLLLVLCSTKPVAELAVAPLETQYVSYAGEDSSTADVRWVLVLGGGVADNPALSPGDQLSRPAAVRLLEGVRQWRQHPQAYLVASGAGVYGGISEAAVMAQLARGLGVPESRIIQDTLSRDTDDQARRLAALIGDAPAILVTSALHMPRSIALFSGQGAHPLPAPTDHLDKGDRVLEPGYFAPHPVYLSTLSAAWHEYLGLLYARLRGDV